MSNIYEIAEKTGLSPSTVARVLSGKGYSSPRAREIVLKAADELHYTPTHAARSLKSKRTEKILMCIPDIYNPYYFKMIQGANDILEKYGYFMLLCHTKHCIEQELNMIRSLTERYGDGMILVSFDFNERNLEAIRNCPMPIVLTNRYRGEKMMDNFDYVYIDDTKGIYLSTKHLLDQGHKEIALITGSTSEQTGKERVDGYIAAMNEYRIPIRNELIIESDYTRKGGYESMSKLLEIKNPPAAVVCANDLMAIGSMDSCRAKGVSIPRSLAIVSMDNTDFCTCTSPTLSSIDMQQEELGRTAATLLMERLSGNRKSKKTIRLEPELIVRDSSVINYNQKCFFRK